MGDLPAQMNGTVMGIAGNKIILENNVENVCESGVIDSAGDLILEEVEVKIEAGWGSKLVKG